MAIVLASQFHVYFGSTSIQPGEGPVKGLCRAYEHWIDLRFKIKFPPNYNDTQSLTNILALFSAFVHLLHLKLALHTTLQYLHVYNLTKQQRLELSAHTT